MANDIKRYLLGLAISFLGTVGICLLIEPDVLRYYGYGISEFGAIHDTHISFLLGFALTTLFLLLIARRIYSISKTLGLIFLLAAFCLGGITITSYPFNAFTYALHWGFVISLTVVVIAGMLWRARTGKMTAFDYALATTFILTTIISILPVVRDIPIFRDFILRELICFISSFWFLGKAVLNRVERDL